MSFYDRQILPRLVESTCGLSTLWPLRERVCAGLAGTVVELGFGSGLNVEFYPPAVTRVLAVEPSDTAWSRAAERVAVSPVSIERIGLDGEALPSADDSVDAVLSTFTLCTIPDVTAALAEVRRVLRPGGTLHVLEHGRADDASVYRWQRRLEPIQKRVAGGCHLTRDIPGLLTGAGFEFVELDRFYGAAWPRAYTAMNLGIARAG